jgi:alkanesulfonate monooxygenase SsuD/methylene tetrahydromethanopterin reductase-like flavin-dependent oxidoreductase (luciferase family)
MLGDHTIFPEKVESHHLYSKNGKSLWDTETGWPDVFTLVAAMARATERLRFSTKVVVLPLRWMAEGYATAGQMVGYDGQHFDFPRSAVSPRPYSRIPSTWLAVARRCSVRRTGQTGWIAGHFTADTSGRSWPPLA